MVTLETTDHTVTTLADAIALLGVPASAASFENTDSIYAFSADTLGPAAFGHPKKVVQVNKNTGYLVITE